MEKIKKVILILTLSIFSMLFIGCVKPEVVKTYTKDDGQNCSYNNPYRSAIFNTLVNGTNTLFDVKTKCLTLKEWAQVEREIGALVNASNTAIAAHNLSNSAGALQESSKNLTKMKAGVLSPTSENLELNNYTEIPEIDN